MICKWSNELLVQEKWKRFYAEEDEDQYKNYNICCLFEKYSISHKVRDDCHLTGKYRGSAHDKCNINVEQQKSISIPLLFHTLQDMTHMFSSKN